jgi:hypothetical protein
MTTIIRKRGDDFQFLDDNDTLLFLGTYYTKRLSVFKKLYTSENTAVSTSVMRIGFPLILRYDIEFISSDDKARMIMPKIWTGDYYLDLNIGRYELIQHLGTKCSFFKNERQIAVLEEKPIEFFGQQTMTLTSDFDVDLTVLFTMILAAKCDFSKDHSTVSLDIGNISPTAKPFNTNWKPKNR